MEGVANIQGAPAKLDRRSPRVGEPVGFPGFFHRRNIPLQRHPLQGTSRKPGKTMNRCPLDRNLQYENVHIPTLWREIYLAGLFTTVSSVAMTLSLSPRYCSVIRYSPC